MSNFVAIINRSSIVSNQEAIIITNALNLVLPQFCEDWSLSPYKCIFTNDNAPNIRLKIYLMDTSDEKDALAYHYINDGIPYGKVFAKTVMSAGGVMLYSPNMLIPTFAQTVCHELFEMIMDPYCNTWSQKGQTLYAYEVCDPVSSNCVTVQVQTGSSIKGKFLSMKSIPTYTSVNLCDWITPAWFNVGAKKGPFNHKQTLSKPFSIEKYGYVIVVKDGVYTTVWGAKITPARKNFIKNKLRVVKHQK